MLKTYIVLLKEDHRFTFLFDEASRSEFVLQLGRFAADPELPFTWQDAAVLSRLPDAKAPPP